ncbi:MAG: PEP-CTERM sorting domain-containing protein [Pseudomonadota bacterium]
MRLIPLVIFSLLIGPSIGSSATERLFDDRAAFTSQTARFTTETFNATRNDRGFAGGSLAFDGFEIRHQGGLGAPFNRLDTPPEEDPLTSIDGSPFLYVGLAPGDRVIFQFDAPITAFAADFAGVDDEGARVVTIAANGGSEIAHGVAQRISFFGLISDTPFSRVTVTGHDAADLGIGIDNISFGAAVPSVPLPGALPLALGMLGLLGLLGWRRRQG